MANSEQNDELKPTQQDHPDDFYEQVLGSFKKKAFTEEEIQEKQSKWQSFEEQEQPDFMFNEFPTYFYAGFWMRFWAFLVDLLCIGAISAITIDSAYQLVGKESSTLLFSLYGLMTMAIYLGYFALLTKLNNGQTIGKMIFGLRVVCATEETLSWKTVLVREVAGRFILQFNPVLMIGYLLTAFTSKKQHAIDYFTDTSVVTINLVNAFNKRATA